MRDVEAREPWVEPGDEPAEGRPQRPWVDRPARPAGGRSPQPWRRFDQPSGPVRTGAPAPPLEEGEELVAGRRPVEEAFAAGRPARRLLVVPQRRQALEKIVLHATTLRIPIVEVEGGSLTSLAGFDGHQGVAVVVDARRFASVDDILARSIERGDPPFVVVLDSLEDPQNVGTLLRSAEGAGVHGVVFPTERQAPLSPAAVKASAGATEHLLLAPVDDLPATLTDLRLRGVRIVGSEADASLTAREADLRGAIALVVGSEGHGLSPAVRRRCDLFVRLPMRGAIGSLNAAVAGSILLFEILGQRDAGSLATPADSQPPPTTKPVRKAAATPKGLKATEATEATEPAEIKALTKPKPVKTAAPKAAAKPKSAQAAEPGATAKPRPAKTAAKATPKPKAATASETKAMAKPTPAKAGKPTAAAKAKPSTASAPKAAASPRAAAKPKTPRRKSDASASEGPATGTEPAAPEAGDDLLPP